MPVVLTDSISVAGVNRTGSVTLNPADPTIISGEVSVANGQTDKAWSFGGVDVSQAVAVYFQSDKAVTLETNATDASGGNTITLAANVPYLWCSGKPDSNKLTQDIASTIYVTNASGSAATVYGVVVQDGTP